MTCSFCFYFLRSACTGDVFSFLSLDRFLRYWQLFKEDLQALRHEAPDFHECLFDHSHELVQHELRVLESGGKGWEKKEQPDESAQGWSTAHQKLCKTWGLRWQPDQNNPRNNEQGK